VTDGGDIRLRVMRRAVAPAALLAGAATGYLLVVRGALTLDLGLGRRICPLGPMRISIAAPRDTVFDVIAGPYLTKTPRAMRAKLDVLERGSDMALAAHFTSVACLTVTTVETIRFKRPELIAFRLLRGPVPHLTETFELHESDDGTELEYNFDAHEETTGIPALLRRIADLGIGFKDLNTRQSSLEDIFVDLVRTSAAA